MVISSGGMLPGGRTVKRTVRATTCWLRRPDGWRIAHEHISVPVDLATGTIADS